MPLSLCCVFIHTYTFIFFQASDKRLIGFGPTIGQREVVRLNLIECESCYQSSHSSSHSAFSSSSKNQHPLTSTAIPHTSSETTSFSTSSSTTTNIPNIETYFGTAPKFWNSLFIAMARLTPQSVLQV